MPFKSWSQIGYLKKRQPKVYKRWKKKYGLPKGGIPKHVRGSGKFTMKDLARGYKKL